MTTPSGPLCGMKVLEFAGAGPTPFCAMLLADLGADVVRIDRPGARGGLPTDIASRGRRSVTLDLKQAAGVETCLKLMERAEAIIEGYKPGLMERLGLGPAKALERNRALVYGRLTGWGQTGTLARAACHDINAIALTGALGAIGTVERPVPPLNLVGGLGGGALYLAFGLVAAVLHARRTGEGQVIDCAMTDGSASLMTVVYGLYAAGMHGADRGNNFADGGAHFYNAYRCADGNWIALGAIEPQLYRQLLEQVGLDDPEFVHQYVADHWPSLKEKLARAIATRSRAEWQRILEGTDACFAPVMSLKEAPHHPHNRARETFVTLDGVVQPAPAPRFSATPGRIQGPPPRAGSHTREALQDWGIADEEISLAIALTGASEKSAAQ